jgi:hypothetical protein
LQDIIIVGLKGIKKNHVSPAAIVKGETKGSSVLFLRLSEFLKLF